MVSTRTQNAQKRNEDDEDEEEKASRLLGNDMVSTRTQNAQERNEEDEDEEEKASRLLGNEIVAARASSDPTKIRSLLTRLLTSYEGAEISLSLMDLFLCEYLIWDFRRYIQVSSHKPFYNDFPELMQQINSAEVSCTRLLFSTLLELRNDLKAKKDLKQLSNKDLILLAHIETNYFREAKVAKSKAYRTKRNTSKKWNRIISAFVITTLDPNYICHLQSTVMLEKAEELRTLIGKK